MIGDFMGKKRIPQPCSVVRNNPHPGRGTVLVLGTPRGGTSVVAGICHMLGVPMGLEIDRSNMEDLRFRALLASDQRAELVSAYLTELQQLGPIVGAKDPTAIDHLAEVYPAIPRPILVVSSRDVYASVQREVAEGFDYFEALRGTVKRKYAVLDFVAATDHPLIVVSYERLMHDPTSAVRSLAQFLLGGVPERLIRNTARLVRPHADMPNDVDFVDARMRYERKSFLRSGSVA
ncbi:MAG: hypothetical protein RLZZ327_55 [Actinomycetota bacterium]